MDYREYELLNGFLLGNGTRLRKYQNREKEAAAHLIAGFDFNIEESGCFATGTVVYFQGNSRGTKAYPNIELGPRALGTQAGGFWSALQQEPDLIESARIDRQKYQTEFGNRFGNYQLQIGDESIACLLLLVDTLYPAGVIRRAFNLSLENAREVMICPSDVRQGYMHVRTAT